MSVIMNMIELWLKNGNGLSLKEYLISLRMEFLTKHPEVLVDMAFGC